MYESYESGPRLCEVARRNLCDSSSGSYGYYDTGGDPEVKANILVNEQTVQVGFSTDFFGLLSHAFLHQTLDVHLPSVQTKKH